MEMMFLVILLVIFAIVPVLLTLMEAVSLFRYRSGFLKPEHQILLDLSVLILGLLFSILYLAIFKNVVFGTDWQLTLTNTELHAPVFSEAAPGIGLVMLAGFAGYFLIHTVPFSKMPPLLMVLGMSGMYLGTGLSILWGVQLSEQIRMGTDLLLYLLPCNCILITARSVGTRVYQWEIWMKDQEHLKKIGERPVLNRLNSILNNSRWWPLLAFLLAWPILGCILAFLMILGQQPDILIKAWTETSDWKLSQQIAPQNIYRDEHYLCTVAAGGHRRVVKPYRKGIRHGHPVTVNRQLCIANAFEQILQEKTPGLHRRVRGCYDRYGFPIARLIHSPFAADFIYFLMKPMEWVFLAVIYLTDVKPENRIALQYTGKNVSDFSEQGERNII